MTDGPDNKPPDDGAPVTLNSFITREQHEMLGVVVELFDKRFGMTAATYISRGVDKVIERYGPAFLLRQNLPPSAGSKLPRSDFTEPEWPSYDPDRHVLVRVTLSAVQYRFLSALCEQTQVPIDVYLREGIDLAVQPYWDLVIQHNRTKKPVPR